MSKTLSQLILVCALALLLAPLLTASQSGPLRPATELELIQGVWEGRGPGGPCIVTIEGNTLSYRQPSSDFWYETTFTLPEGTEPKQLHATIVANVHDDDIGTVVVTIYKLEGDQLTLGVVEDFSEAPTDPVVGDWDWVADMYDLERAVSSQAEDRKATVTGS
ncbi:MAG: hypothetical protein AAF604_06255 [Acidobacteriota bacterium]